MHRIAKSISRVVLVLSAIGIFLVPGFNFTGRPSLARTTCVQSCDGLETLPPQSPGARSYDSFVTAAYLGAYGTGPTCLQRQLECASLANAPDANALLAEAKRFVATLFMTQASYNAQDLTTYTQTTKYELVNSQNNTDRASIESFVTDLYQAFLQREPDPGGKCFWANDVCSNNDQGNAGRKHAIRAFEVSIEFGSLVTGLFDTGPVCCPKHCPIGSVWDCDLGACSSL